LLLTGIQLPNAALKNVRLLNQQWSGAAGPPLWNTLCTRHKESNGRTLDALLQSRDTLPLVKTIDLLESNPSDTVNEGLLAQLLCALPQDNLQMFIYSADISGRMIELLLQTQG
jgi:hypothetical protein